MQNSPKTFSKQFGTPKFIGASPSYRNAAKELDSYLDEMVYGGKGGGAAEMINNKTINGGGKVPQMTTSQSAVNLTTRPKTGLSQRRMTH